MSATRLMMLGCPDVLAARIDAQITAQVSDADELVASGLHPVTASEVARCINSLTNDPRPLIALGVQPHLANEIVKLTAEGAGLVFDNDFTQGYLDPRITFSRPGDSGRVVDGTYRVWGPDEPVLVPDGWSVRPAETNLAGGDLTTYAAIRSTAALAGMYGPENSIAEYVIGATSTTFGAWRNWTGGAAAGKYTWECVLRPGTVSTARLTLYDGSNRYASFDLTGAGSVIDAAPSVSASITRLADGRYLARNTATATNPITQCQVGFVDSTLSGTETFYASAPQFNAADPIPYIPTTSGAVTRPADDVDILGSDFAGIWNPTDWAVILDVGQLVNTPLGYLFSVSDGTVSNFAGIQINSSGALDFQNTGTGGGGVIGAPASWPYAGKVGLTQSGGRIRCHVDGTKKLDIAATVPAAISRFSLGKVASQNRLPITSRRLAIFNQGLSEARMDELTS